MCQAAGQVCSVGKAASALKANFAVFARRS